MKHQNNYNKTLLDYSLHLKVKNLMHELELGDGVRCVINTGRTGRAPRSLKNVK